MHHLLRFEEHLLKTKVPSSFKKIFNNEKCMCDPFLNIYIIRCKEKPTVKLVSIFMKFVEKKRKASSFNCWQQTATVLKDNSTNPLILNMKVYLQVLNNLKTSDQNRHSRTRDTAIFIPPFVILLIIKSVNKVKLLIVLLLFQIEVNN